MNSFASRTIREIAQMIRLRGAETVIVGIQPEVARHGAARIDHGRVATALDLDEGLEYLNQKRKTLLLQKPRTRPWVIFLVDEIEY